MTPKRNCLKCKLYDACAIFDDGRCLLLERKGVEKHECYGFLMTAPQWAEFLGISASSVNKAARDGKLDELFERCAKRDFDKMHPAEKAPPKKVGRPKEVYAYKGISKTAYEWAKIWGVSTQTVWRSIKSNTFEERCRKHFEERGAV